MVRMVDRLPFALREVFIDTLLVLAAALLAIVLVDPRGEMPLNDDWSFALATWHFADTGEFRFARMTAMSLRAQVVWGALWTNIAGESFEVLRYSTLTLSVLTILILQALMRFLGWSAWQRRVVSLTLFFSPVFFALSFTYMTHIPYVFLSVCAMYCWLRAYRGGGWLWFGLGLIAAFASCFVRQTGVVNLALPLVSILLAREERPREWKRFLVATCTALAAFAALYLMTDVLKGYPQQLDQHTGLWSAGMGQRILLFFSILHQYVVQNFSHSAVHFFPLSLAAVVALLASRSKSRILTALLAFPFFLWLAVESVGYQRPMMFHHRGNILANFSIGPHTLVDTFVWEMPYPFRLSWIGVAVLTYLSAVTGAVLLALCGTAAIGAVRRRLPPELLFPLAQILAGTLILVASGIYFDRYALDALWALVLFVPPLIEWTKGLRRLAVVTLIVVALFSVGATQDYLAWNRARWVAFHTLRANGITLQKMDGGYEINQFLVGGFDGPLSLGRANFSVTDDRYVLTFRPVEGYRTLAVVPYQGFFGLHEGGVFILERTSGFIPQFDLD